METVERTVTLPTGVEEAWDLLTRPEDLEGWLGAEVVLDATPGSAGIVVDHDGTRRHLVVDRVTPGQGLAWRWWVDGDEAGATEVEVTLAPALDGTVVTVVERALEPGGLRACSATDEGWALRLLHLEALLVVAAVRT